MEILKNISIRGRMAYLICLFERLLLYYNYDKDEWRNILEKLWKYTSIELLDDWMYKIAEYMPNSILEDTMDDAEYITEDEFKHLNKVYGKTIQEVLLFLQIIFECGTCEIYSKLCDNSPNTIIKVEEGIHILKMNNIALVDIKNFEKYKYSECDGWGEQFDGKVLSIIVN